MSKTETNKENISTEKKVKKKEKTVQIPTKVVVRRLPCTMSEESFVEFFSPLPEHNMFRYVYGDRSLAPHNFCRAYIDFKNVNEILQFRDKFDGVNVEINGVSSMCLVEYAPCQKLDGIGRKKKKEDAKCGTIYEDAAYKAFLESQEKVEEKEALDVEQYLEELEKREKKNEVNETPLTLYMKQKAIERKKKLAKIREEKRKKELEMKMKREEERRKRREMEKKKQAAASRQKRDSHSRSESEGKKTLAETRPTKNNRDEEENKVKILQKEKSTNEVNSPTARPKVTLLKRPTSQQEDKKANQKDRILAAKTNLKGSGFFDSTSEDEFPAKSSERKGKSFSRDGRDGRQERPLGGGRKQYRGKSPKSGVKKYSESKKFPSNKTRNPDVKVSGSSYRSGKDLDREKVSGGSTKYGKDSEKRKPRPTQQFYNPKSDKSKKFDDKNKEGGYKKFDDKSSKEGVGRPRYKFSRSKENENENA